MHKLILQLESLTKRFVQTLDEKDYDEIQHFLLAREQIVANIQNQEWSDEQLAEAQDAIAGILSYDHLIENRIHHVKNQIQASYTKLTMAKKQKQTYETMGYIYDGLYFDKKK